MPHIGEFATSMEMAGLSVTLLKLDAELKELLQAPANTPFYTNANKWGICHDNGKFKKCNRCDCRENR